MTSLQLYSAAAGATAAGTAAGVAVEHGWTTTGMIGVYMGIITVATLIVNARIAAARESRQRAWEVEDRKWKAEQAAQVHSAALHAAEAKVAASAIKAEVASSRSERAGQMTDLLTAMAENTALTEQVKQTVESK